MLQKLSYFNLLFALVYVLVYLKSGTFNSTAGIFVIIFFNWLCIRSYQLDRYKWGIVHYLAFGWSFYYIGFIIYGGINILSATLEFNFISNDILMLLLISLVFSVSVMVHGVSYFYLNFKENKT